MNANIVGEGQELLKLKNKCLNNRRLKDCIVFLGKIPYEKMKEEYKKADVFIMPSIRETTGSVLLEVIANEISAITINKFGGAVLLDESCAWLSSEKNKESYVSNPVSVIIECIKNPEVVYEKGKVTRLKSYNYTLEKKLEFYQ